MFISDQAKTILRFLNPKQVADLYEAIGVRANRELTLTQKESILTAVTEEMLAPPCQPRQSFESVRQMLNDEIADLLRGKIMLLIPKKIDDLIARNEQGISAHADNTASKEAAQAAAIMQRFRTPGHQQKLEDLRIDIGGKMDFLKTKIEGDTPEEREASLDRIIETALTRAMLRDPELLGQSMDNIQDAVLHELFTMNRARSLDTAIKPSQVGRNGGAEQMM